MTLKHTLYNVIIQIMHHECEHELSKLVNNDSTDTNSPDLVVYKTLVGEKCRLTVDNSSDAFNTDLSVYKTLTGEEPTSIKSWVSKYAEAFR